MADSLSETINKLPPWVFPAGAVLALLLALSRSKSGGGSDYGLVRAYQPVASDPGAISLATAEVTARSGAFNQLVSAVAGEDVSRIAASRDVALQTIQGATLQSKYNADLENTRITSAVAERLGLATFNRDLTVSIKNAEVASSLGLADVQSRNYVAELAQALGLANVDANKTTSQAALDAALKSQSASNALSLKQSQIDDATKRAAMKNDFWKNLFRDIPLIGGLFF